MDAIKRRLSPGDLVAGRFCVVAPLGEGGAGAVYRVRDERGGRELALKQLHFSGGPEHEARRTLFEREYHTLCQFAHPRIIAVFDYGVDGDNAFYTMELLDGLDLQSQGRRPWREACGLLCDVASSLAIVHSRRLVHRDVSARNVRCTSDGRAKLLDFGALSPMGAARQLVGTPPYVPPEALERQGLDGRADLYGLGALAYFLLTGYHAYHARSAGQLRSVWRSPPLPPSQYASELPAALDQLVLELLALDRSARPNSAAEAMERFSGIAGLPLTELAEVRRSYLVMPGLVGRDEPLQQVRAELQAMIARGRGRTFSIEGVAGAGRSRMLAACLLEAKLLGIRVVRADASDNATGDYGVVRALCAQLWQDAPELCEQAAQGRERMLAHVLPALAPRVVRDEGSQDGSDPARPAARKRLQSAIRDFLTAFARERPLAIGVDDVESIDEPSAALLGLLAHVAKLRPVTLITSTRPTADSTGAVTLIRELGMVVNLPPLDAEQTDALLRSVFGDVDHVTGLAHRIHDLAGGNPRWTMMLAEHVVERGVASYEAGSWALSPDQQAYELPDSLSDALATRIALLEPDARALAETLAHTEPSRLAIDRYPWLCEYDDHARSYRALQELVSSGVLLAEGDRCRFSQLELAHALRSRVDARRACGLHVRIAAALASAEDALLLAHHMFLGGLEREGLELLVGWIERPRLDSASYSQRAIELFERALAASERLRYPLAARLSLQSFIVHCASVRGDLATLSRIAPPLLAQLEVATGLRAREGGDASSALADGADRAALPDSSLSALAAAKLLGTVCASVSTMANIAQAPELLARLPSLRPLGELWPLLPILQTLVEGSAANLTGAFGLARERTHDVLTLLTDPAPGVLDPFHAEQLRLGALYGLGLYYAALGSPRSAQWLVELQQNAGFRANAARVRMVYELMHGDIEAASARRRRAELLSMQDGTTQVLPGSTTRIELLAFALADNVLGVKRTLERVAPMAALYPGWCTTLCIGRAQYRRLQGDLRGALEALAPALPDVAIGRHMDWGWSMATQLTVLTGLGARAEAAALAFECLEQLQRTEYTYVHPSLPAPLCEALARGGDCDRASGLIERIIETYTEVGAAGLPLGLCHEAAARVAMLMGDIERFTHHARLCANEYRAGRNSTLQARFGRLLQEADDLGLPVSYELPREPLPRGSGAEHTRLTVALK
jgi:hypothetical protein